MVRRAVASTVVILTLPYAGGIATTIAQSSGSEEAVATIGKKLIDENLGDIHDFSLRMSRNPEIPYTAALRGLLEVEQTTRPLEYYESEGLGRPFEFGQDPLLQFNFSPEKLDADPRYIENLARAVREAQDDPVFGIPEGEDIQGYNLEVQPASEEIRQSTRTVKAMEEPVVQEMREHAPTGLQVGEAQEHQRETAKVQTELRVFQGLEIMQPDPYPDAVLVLGSGQICSGTLVNQKAVITAAHCYCGGVNERVLVGLSSIQFDKVVEVEKDQSAPFVDCDAEDYTKKGDYAVLILAEEVNVAPRRLATRDMVERSAFLRLVGFGKTPDDVIGRKFYVDAPIASYDCTGTIPGPRGVGRVSDQAFYGCSPDFEIVAGGLGRDTCNGDSGGPAYILGGDGRLYLAGATSRGVSGEVKPCGEGGIYPRIDEKLASWLENLGIDVEVGRP